MRENGIYVNYLRGLVIWGILSLPVMGADPLPLNSYEKAFINAYSKAYCSQYVSYFKSLADAAKNTPRYSGLNNLYLLVNSYCVQANRLRERDAAYAAWLAAKSKPPVVSPAPAKPSSDQLFGTLDPNGPNDQYYSAQRSLGLDRIGIMAAWKLNRDCGDIPIWVFDTGIDANHSELKASIRVKDGYNYVANNTNFNDDHWHGTFVAGLMASTTNNKTGAAGICWRSTIIPQKVLNAQGTGTTSDILRAVNRASQSITDSSKVTVFNLSISYMDSVSFELKNVRNPTPMTDAIRAAGQKNIVMVIAAGNSGRVLGDSKLTAALPKNLLVVGATDSSDRLASFSNYGDGTTIYAPGVSLISTTPGTRFGQASGTSFSAPVTAGVVALFAQKNPQLKADDIVTRVLKTADVLKDPKQAQMPRLNAGKLLAGN